MLLSSIIFGGNFICSVSWINEDKNYFIVMGSDRENGEKGGKEGSSLNSTSLNNPSMAYVQLVK